MTIVLDDLKFLASERLNDDFDGGGLPTGTAIQDGLENNIFQDIGTMDRVDGRLQLRKIFPSVLSANTDVFIGAYVIMDDGPDDPDVDCFIFRYGNLATERSVASLSCAADVLSYSEGIAATGVAGQFSVEISIDDYAKFYNYLQPATGGGGLGFRNYKGSYTINGGTGGGKITSTQLLGAGLTARVRLEASDSGESQANAVTVTQIFIDIPAQNSIHGISFLSEAAAIGDTAIGLEKTQIDTTLTVVGAFHAKDKVVIHETFSNAPAVLSAGTVSTGKTNLKRVRIIGHDGVDIGRYEEGGTQPIGTGASVNFATGVVTISSVAGWSQPATLEYRIENLRIAVEVDYEANSITLNEALTQNFTTGAKCSAVVFYGDMFAHVHRGFAQTAWTGTWADDFIGSQPLADFNQEIYPITSENRGSVTERWALFFTNTTTFRVVGEAVGQVLIGNTGEACAPVNPATLTPYFSIPAEGWNSGWSAGNVYRFNTEGANFPLWCGRAIHPSEPTTLYDSMSVQMRGDVDAP